MINAVIIDDEDACREAVLHMITLLDLPIQINGMADSARMGLELCTRLNPELILLDIEMPDHDGFWLLEKLPLQKSAVVFITAYEHYAVKAFRYAALDYLLKPLHPVHFRETMNKLCGQESNALNIQNTLQRLQEGLVHKRLSIPTNTGHEFVEPGEIAWISAENNYSRIWLQNGKQYLVAKTLGKYEEILKDDPFLRIHKSYLINMQHLRAWTVLPRLQVTLDGKTWLDVSTRKNDSFLENLSPQQHSLRIPHAG